MATTYSSQGSKDTTDEVFSVSNFVEDYSLDANTATLGVTSDVLATLIRTLQRLGIIKGTVVTA